jgi:hypothetical protein
MISGHPKSNGTASSSDHGFVMEELLDLASAEGNNKP